MMSDLVRLPGRGFATSLLMMVFWIVPLQVQSELTDEQSKGKQIYFAGTSPSGSEISAIVGSEEVTLPASAVPCSSCHGTDGLGRPEGGVIPPDIRWSELTKVYGHVHENGREHPAFDQSSLARLIRTGVDPADNLLDKSMPLYKMSVKDMRNLIAYMQFLETDFDPGLDKSSVQVATLLPLAGSQGALGQAMAQSMLAHFKNINDSGGIFGRKIELLAIPYGVSAEATLDNLRKAFKQEGVFALVGAYTVGMDEQVLELLREEKMPMVGPFTLNPGDAFLNSDTFYIYSGFTAQAQALAAQAVEQMKGGKGKLALVGPDDENVDDLMAAVMESQSKDNIYKSDTLLYKRGKLDAAALAKNLQQTGSDAVLFLGIQAELEALLKALDEIQHYPGVFALSAFIPKPLTEAPSTFNQRIFLAYPTMTSDITSQGRAEYLGLADRHALPPGHLQGQIAALTAAKLLEEGLRGAGRTLNRERLVKAIEALYRFETGLTPPLTFGPNRRIGALGAHVMTVDLMQKASATKGAWRELQ